MNRFSLMFSTLSPFHTMTSLVFFQTLPWPFFYSAPPLQHSISTPSFRITLDVFVTRTKSADTRRPNSIAELNIGLICACMPSVAVFFRPLVARLAARLSSSFSPSPSAFSSSPSTTLESWRSRLLRPLSALSSSLPQRRRRKLKKAEKRAFSPFPSLPPSVPSPTPAAAAVTNSFLGLPTPTLSSAEVLPPKVPSVSSAEATLTPSHLSTAPLPAAPPLTSSSPAPSLSASVLRRVAALLTFRRRAQPGTGDSTTTVTGDSVLSAPETTVRRPSGTTPWQDAPTTSRAAASTAVVTFNDNDDIYSAYGACGTFGGAGAAPSPFIFAAPSSAAAATAAYQTDPAASLRPAPLRLHPVASRHGGRGAGGGLGGDILGGGVAGGSMVGGDATHAGTPPLVVALPSPPASPSSLERPLSSSSSTASPPRYACSPTGVRRATPLSTTTTPASTLAAANAV
jgi:hypothetical protein